MGLKNKVPLGTIAQPVRLLLAVLLALSWLAPWQAVADDTQETFGIRFVAEGRYGIAANGVGLDGLGSGAITLSVPGTAIEAAYLYWSGYDEWTGGDNTIALAVDGPTVAPALIAMDQFGPAFWYDGFHYFVWLADVTSYVQLGAHTYTISGFDSAVAMRNGAGLMVVYEDASLPVGRVEIQDGLDRFYRGWGEGERGETAVNCFSFDPAGFDRALDLTMFVADIVASGAPRPDALWYLTGSSTDPMPLDMVNAPDDGPFDGSLVEGPPSYPFQSSDGPQWDTYENTITIPTGDSWACFQIESAEYLDYQPASGVGVALAGRWQTMGEVDLEISKEDNPDPVVPGQQLTYLLHYANNGPGDAEDVVISDLLPPEVTYVDADPDPDGGPNPLTWDLGKVLDGDEDTISILVTVQPWVTQTFTNSVTITSSTTESDYGNNQDEEPTQVLPEADVAISKVDDPDPVLPGELLTYTLHYVNNGPSTAQDVVVTDQLPPQVTFVDAEPDPTTGPNPLVWHLGGLDPGPASAGVITVVVSVQPSAQGTFTNTATIGTETPESDYNNNQDEEPTSVLRRADVTVAKADDPDPVVPGEHLTYTLHYANNGPDPAESVVLSDQLPPEVVFVDADPDPTSGPNPLTWSLGQLDVDEEGEITVVVAVHSWVTRTFTNTIAITTVTPETNDGNNQDNEPTEVAPEADVSVVKTDAPDPVIPGQQLVYTLLCANHGPSDAQDVVVSDLLPPEVTFVGATPSPTSGPNPLSWNLGELAAGESTTIQVTVLVQPWVSETFTNAVSIATNTPEGDYTNNSDEEPTDVIPRADVSIIKQDDPDPVVGGEQLVYTLFYGNNGPSEAVNVVVSDQLPPEVTFLSADPAPSAGPNPLVWNLGSLEVGETGTIEVRVEVPIGMTGTFTNHVTITTETPETDTTNNSDEEPTEVRAGPVYVDLLYFRGTPAGREVLLEWATAWERDNWGFSIYRSQAPEFSEEVENLHFAQARGRGQFDGETYAYVDRSVAPGQVYYYWLEDIDIFGITTRHGPIRIANLYHVLLPAVNH